MKFITSLTLVAALSATTIVSAGFTWVKASSPTRVTYQPIMVSPTPIYALPTVNTVPAVVAQPVPYVQPAHLTEGLRLVDEINATHSLGIFEDNEGTPVNRYGGSWEDDLDPSFIRFFDEGNGILPANNTVCAPLVTHLLLHSYGWDWGDDQFEFADPKNGNQLRTSESPNPWQYLALIDQGIGFESKITNIRQSKPGDIISIHYLSGTSGHTAILVDLHLEDPMAYPQNGNNLVPELAGTHFYRMTIMDSTSYPHSNDTRRFTVTDEDDVVTNHQITGAGTGDMGIFLDINGNIIGHMWSLPNSAYGTQGWLNRIEDDVELQSERHMVFGRLPANP